MQTMNPTTARPESRTRRRRPLVLATCLAFTLLAGLGVNLWLDHRVPRPDADAGRISRYMASPAFAVLSEAQKAPYMDAFQRASDRGELTPEQQRGVISNLARRNGENPIQQYLSLPPGRERQRFLDDVIDRVLKADKSHPRADRAAKGKGDIQIDGGRLVDAIPPEERAQMDQFLQELHDRRVERGVPDDGRFLFNRTP